MPTDYKLFKYCFLKKKNRRIEILVYKDELTKDVCILINTKRLVDFKKREVIVTETAYGTEALHAMLHALMMLDNDSEYRKAVNHLTPKERFTCYSNIERLCP